MPNNQNIIMHFYRILSNIMPDSRLRLQWNIFKKNSQRVFWLYLPCTPLLAILSGFLLGQKPVAK